ncbi:site-specific DNA-methyltransferase [Myxococcota bacterium]|nr:site-specific DNA-methyltransferase [Myxococcota bacterium]
MKGQPPPRRTSWPWQDMPRPEAKLADHADRERLYQADPNFGSVVSYPARCPAWGKSSYRGNCDGTLFKELLLRYRPKTVADPMMGSGTTGDVVRGMNRHLGTGIEFFGADLRTGFDLERDPLPGPFEFIWLHPPYWDIVRYSQADPRDLSQTAEWPDFCMRLSACLLRCAGALTPGGHLAVLVGDIRKRGRYYSMAAELLSHRGAFGELRSILIKGQHRCTSDRKTYAPFVDAPIRHEYCLLFRRPSA